ncbi:MAG: nicotinate-nucleotide diphosphorylase (carboxylating), partial [Desulfovibrionaceae bacterium]|nr:nicotinate-nucleotide diphosphorylase (carboxylating) [Desulfovibrionaceae bacterium]
MHNELFERFFTGRTRDFLLRGLDLALAEDGRDESSLAVFGPADRARAAIVAKQDAVLAGGPLIALILARCDGLGDREVQLACADSQSVAPGQVVAEICAPALNLLQAERVILNYVTHLSGVASLTRRYVLAMGKTRTRLLDTRKTLPGLRYPEKYAVLAGGGCNHRLSLEDMLMFKDTHLDRAGGIGPAARALRQGPDADRLAQIALEIECRDLAEVREAVAQRPGRIMFDNMGEETIRQALAVIPPGIE